MTGSLSQPRIRSALVYLVIVALVFASTLTAGFVFAHEPQRDTVSIAVRDSPLTPPAWREVFGVIGEVRPGAIVIAGEEQSTVVELPAGVPTDELSRLVADGPPLSVGAAVNIGTASTSTGFIVTGIVAVDEATP